MKSLSETIFLMRRLGTSIIHMLLIFQPNLAMTDYVSWQDFRQGVSISLHISPPLLLQEF